jgi:glycosyltransferase involved in cell wall biosynthesis
MKPLVSILIPAFNAEAFLADTLRSVLAQTYPQVEVIVVNDGSKDNTLAVARSFENERVKVIDQKNRGQSASENVAFNESQGDYIVYLDADDLISPNKIEVQLDRLQRAEPGCVAFHSWGRFYDKTENARFNPEPFWRDIDPIDFHIEMWERASMIQGACYLIPRSLVQQAGPWDESLSLINDFDFFPRVLLRARQLLFCPEAVLYYRSGLPNALSGTKSRAAWDSAFRALGSGTQRLLTDNNSPPAQKACSRAFEEFVYASYPAVPELRQLAWEQVQKLGGPYSHPQMGPKMKLVSRIVGWKLAKRLQSIMRRVIAKGA